MWRWLRGWSLWADSRPNGADPAGGPDRRPWHQRVAVFVGIRREW